MGTEEQVDLRLKTHPSPQTNISYIRLVCSTLRGFVSRGQVKETWVKGRRLHASKSTLQPSNFWGVWIVVNQRT